MKIGKERIKGLVQRNIASGLAYYWEPDPRERKAGWKTLTLGMDLLPAIEGAKKRNAEIVRWRSGGERPAAIVRHVAPQTFGAVIARYRAEKLVGLAANTQRTAATELDKLDTWAGKHPLHYITRARVRALKLALCPDADTVPRMLRDGIRDITGHSIAFKLLCKGREVWGWWNDHPHNGRPLANPFERFDLPKPPPRDQIWEPDCEAAFSAAATDLGWHSVGFALRLANGFGQREADLLALDETSWREISLRQLRNDRELYDALASDHGPDAGKVMGFYKRTGKTRRWVGVPIAGALRDEVEAAIAAGRARARAEAAAARLAGKPEPIPAPRPILARDPVDPALWTALGDEAPAGATAKEKAAWAGRKAGLMKRAAMAGRKWSQRDFIERIAEIRAHAAATARAAGNIDLADRIDQLEFRDTRRTCVVHLGELGMDDAAISAITTHSLATIKAILETYMPRTEAMAARGVVASLDAARRRGSEQREQQG